MTYTADFLDHPPERAALDASPEPVLLEFGVPWCPHCQGAQPSIEASLGRHPQLRHLKIEDGPGRPLGRSFRVKLWPTLILLRGGQEVGRVVRPTSTSDLDALLATI